ncbi:MAG: adenylate/guanylate cyclase domain-containing protein [Rhizobiaceae bacterium]
MAKRKLTTIFCADAVQYGALMATDEDGTLARLQEYRDLMNDQFSRYDGREINTWGDAIIAEFDSVVEAVRCAVEIQTALGSRNDLLPSNSKLQFRIGINLGDVIHQGDNIYGDGVNVASRLEALADPGGIMVSKSVHDFAARQLAVAFDFGGKHVAKEGETPIESYKVRIATTNHGGDEDERDEDSERGNAKRDAHPSSFADDARTFADDVRSLPTIARYKAWFEAQPRKVRVAAITIAGLFAINVLFGGLANPWFLYPSIPLAAIIWFGRRNLDDVG